MLGESAARHGCLGAPSARAQPWSRLGPEGGPRLCRAARKAAARCPLPSARRGAGARGRGIGSASRRAGALVVEETRSSILDPAPPPRRPRPLPPLAVASGGWDELVFLEGCGCSQL